MTRALPALAALLCALGLAQFAALFVRDEPHLFAAALLALLLCGGGAALTALVAWNAPRDAKPLERWSLPEALTALALAALAGEALLVWRDTGVFFPLRMSLFWRTPDAAEAPLPMMLAGTCLVGLGAVATAALAGALWLLFYARRWPARIAGAALSLLGAVPYVAFALVVRALVCGPTALLAAGRSLALRPDEQLAYRSLLALAPGALLASVALGLPLARGLWSWLEQVRAAEEASDSFLAAEVRGQKPWQIVLRQGIWLRRRRELGALLLGGFAAAALIDILSNTLIDSFRPPGFPPYPSLGAALFLRGIADSGAPPPLPPQWIVAHVAVVLASLLLLLAQTLPRKLQRAPLAQEAPSAHALAQRPALQWLLGVSGSGKTTLLEAWRAQLPGSVLVPQDPDHALPAAFSATELARDAQHRVLWDLLGRMDDERVRRALFDPFTAASSLSRGERQRLVLSLALGQALRSGCTLFLDEPTSAQDGARTQALLDCVRELLPKAGDGSVVITCHDPEPLDLLLGDRAAQSVADHVLWLEEGRAHAYEVRGSEWQGPAQPPGLERYRAAGAALLEARAFDHDAGGASGEGLRVLPPWLDIGGRRHSISPEARIRGGELIVLSGRSGSGKSTLLKALARHDGFVELGYVLQDPARALPPEMPVREALGAQPEKKLLERWFGAELTAEMLARPVGALSEGERQRVLIAGEVLRLEQSQSAPLRLLLLDEPFGALDPAAHLRLLQSLCAWLRDERNAAVLVSHSPQVDLGLARAARLPAREWSMNS